MMMMTMMGMMMMMMPVDYDDDDSDDGDDGDDDPNEWQCCSGRTRRRRCWTIGSSTSRPRRPST
jgi:hypothetical protein